MAVKIRGESDEIIHQFVQALERYQAAHPKAKIEIYRQNHVSLRVRIIDPDFKGIAVVDRHDLVWKLFEDLPEEVQWELSVLLLLTPQETKTSFANMEFDHPVASTL